MCLTDDKLGNKLKLKILIKDITCKEWLILLENDNTEKENKKVHFVFGVYKVTDLFGKVLGLIYSILLVSILVRFLVCVAVGYWFLS